MTDDELTLHYGQDIVLEDYDRREHAVIAGIGYGKTKFGPAWLEKRRTDNFKSKEFLVVAPNYKLLKKRAFEDYREHLALTGYVEGKHFRYNKSDPSFYFRKNGQSVIGLTGESADRIVAFTSAAAWVDEAALCVEQVRKNLIKRNRCPRARRRRQILYTTTPEGVQSWLYNVFNPQGMKETESGVIEYSKTKLILHGSSFDNPYLDEEFFSTLREEFGFDENYFANYVLGKWVSLAKNQFYFGFSEAKHVGVYPLEPDLNRFVLSFDANIGQMSWCVLQEVAKVWRCTDENASSGYNIEHACEQFIERFPPVRFRDFAIKVLGDASLHARSVHSHETGFDMIERFLGKHYPKMTFDAPRGNPFVNERSICTNKLFRSNRLFINRSCKKTIESAKLSMSDGKGGIKKGPKDTVTHAMEALDMALIVLEPSKVRTSDRAQGARW